MPAPLCCVTSLAAGVPLPPTPPPRSHNCHCAFIRSSLRGVNAPALSRYFPPVLTRRPRAARAIFRSTHMKGESWRDARGRYRERTPRYAEFWEVVKASRMALDTLGGRGCIIACMSDDYSLSLSLPRETLIMFFPSFCPASRSIMPIQRCRYAAAGGDITAARAPMCLLVAM